MKFLLNTLGLFLFCVMAVAAAQTSKPLFEPQIGAAVLLATDFEPITATTYETVRLADGRVCMRSITNAGSLSTEVGLHCDLKIKR